MWTLVGGARASHTEPDRLTVELEVDTGILSRMSQIASGHTNLTEAISPKKAAV